MEKLDFIDIPTFLSEGLQNITVSKLILAVLNHIQFFYFVSGMCVCALGVLLAIQYPELVYTTASFPEVTTSTASLTLYALFLTSGIALIASANKFTFNANFLYRFAMILSRLIFWSAIGILTVSGMSIMTDIYEVVPVPMWTLQTFISLYGWGITAYAIFGLLWILCGAFGRMPGYKKEEVIEATE